MAASPATFHLIRDVLSKVEVEVSDRRAFQEEVAAGGAVDYHPGLEKSQFSDTIVMSAPFTADAVDSLIASNMYLAAELLKEGVFVRGGIAAGWMFHKRDVLFGDGLIAAYDIENRIAKYPRIVVADEVAELSNCKLEHLLLDVDGCRFVDVFDALWDGDQLAIPDSRQFNLVRENILRALHGPESRDLDVRAKLMWMVHQFNEALRRTRTKWSRPEWGFDDVAMIEPALELGQRSTAGKPWLDAFLGDGDIREVEYFAKVPPAEYLQRHIVGLGNSGGGTLFIGIGSLGEVHGISQREADEVLFLLKFYVNLALRTTAEVGLAEVDGKRVAFARIAPAPQHLRPIKTSSGAIYVREGNATIRVPTTADEPSLM